MATSNPQHPKENPLDLQAGWFYHITTQEAWLAAQGQGYYTHSSLETEGFIHFSFPDQVAATQALHFKGQGGLVLLEVEPDRLRADLRIEMSRNGERFPHLYGPLNLDAVVRILALDEPMAE